MVDKTMNSLATVEHQSAKMVAMYIILYKTFEYVRQNFAEEVKAVGGTMTAHYQAIIDAHEAEFEAHFVDWELLDPQSVSATARTLTKVCNEANPIVQARSE
eukprot:m.213031 g.213031  ORF g.213031 m.213031 type:complete len:102 (-) comp26343_c0_seq2:6-311(-)